MLRRIQRLINTHLHRSSCKIPIILVRFEENLNFLDRFSTNPQILNFMKLLLLGAELFHAYRQTDMTKPTVAFRNVSNVPNRIFPYHRCVCACLSVIAITHQKIKKRCTNFGSSFRMINSCEVQIYSKSACGIGVGPWGFYPTE
jgi:hypothetical protein